MHGFPTFMSLSSLLTHPTGQRYDTQQLDNWEVGGQYDTPVSFKYDVSLKPTIKKPEIPGKCHFLFLHNNHAITFKLSLLTTHLYLDLI